MTAIWGALAVAAWGTWLYPARLAPGANQVAITFYVTVGNLLFAFVLYATRFEPIPLGVWLAAIIAGGIWSAGGICAFSATRLIGPATAMSIWSPLNILVSVTGGALIFHEWQGLAMQTASLRGLSLLVLSLGLLSIIRSTSTRDSPGGSSSGGFFFAVATGFLWAAYIFPIRSSGTSLESVILPMAIGMFATSAGFALLRKTSLHAGSNRAFLALSGSGILWAIGNFASLKLIERIGVGPGFSVAQLCLVVNALVGIFVFRQPSIRSRASKRLLAGCAIAAVGGAGLGLTLG